MISFQATTHEGTHSQITNIFQEKRYLTQCELDDKGGISFGVLDYSVKVLIEMWLSKMYSFTIGNIKCTYVYLFTPRDAMKKFIRTTPYLMRQNEEISPLRVEMTTLKAEAYEGQAEVPRKHVP